MENFGYITLNISLVLYFVHFLPQTIHNQFKHKTFEISLWTHSLMIFANALDLIYAIGFKLQWQYVLIDIFLLGFLTIQQFQILNDRRDKKMLIHTLCILIFLLLIALIIFSIKLNETYLLWCGSISGVIYNIYYLPQICKNYLQGDAQGFSIFYLGLLAVNILCDINSAIFLNWPIVSLLVSCCMFILVFIQILQYLYYKNISSETILKQA
ncbi:MULTISPECIES: PQ-loop repeat-containing protein [unclassified Francisella]|uniref:PQ-loop repeat-containing protein n=1 Tax=unclassified Francisella TaxID=2610885 RepID=UPI002E30DA2B|nr:MULTISPECIES: PQ-loop repeat-containing protein [unclassified Francisella]MED7819817.1 PQ-loop repeat-containing protein [Francisella sp. 19S2-4]MED7830637.1 PQ-loop repeat-containing protein [Francisella sp. 19S2-10]